jgi:acetyltransferase-like isoleucine patch superfamily enzyme
MIIEDEWNSWNKEPVAFKAVLRRLLVSTFNAIQGSAFVSIPLRMAILRWAGMKTGEDCCIFEGTYVGYPRHVKLGNGVFINAGCSLDDSAEINIGTNVYIAAGVRILTGSHAIGERTCRAGKHRQAPVTIKLGCWIGTASLILPGITIAEGCVVAAGSVVTKDTEPHGLYAGMPAKRLRDLGEDEEEWAL